MGNTWDRDGDHLDRIDDKPWSGRFRQEKVDEMFEELACEEATDD